MPRSELSEKYDRLMGIVSQVLGLNEEERGFVLDRIAPEPETPKVKRRRKRVSATQSHAASQTTSTKKKGLPANTEGACGYENCGQPFDNRVHDKTAGYAGYHEFVPAKKLKAVGASGD